MWNKLKGLMASLVVVSFMASPVMAQTTSSSLSGVVKDTTGEAMEGATISIVHVPSGSQKEVASSTSGRFLAKGLRVGGPYKVTVSKDGFSAETAEGVYLELGKDRNLDVVLKGDKVDLDKVEVVGYASSGVFDPSNMGSGVTLTREEIDAMPSVSRGIADFARMDPRITVLNKGENAFSVGGQNNRYNNVAIDGVPTNDEFGLEAGGLPSMQRGQPFSLETIDQFNIAISPYDVSKSNFVGGDINAVTKSGTNEFHGSVYYIYRDDSMVGEDEDGNAFDTFEEWTRGVTFGGPIIQDKLFFFLNYEEFENIEALEPAFTPEAADMQRIRDIAAGYGATNIGDLNASELKNADEKILLKVDWNINDQHRLTARYNSTEGSEINLANRGNFDASLDSHWYTNTFDTENYSVQLYSDWTQNFSTELNVAQMNFHKFPDNGSRMPYFRIDGVNGVSGSGEDTTGEVHFGTERFRHANDLVVDTTSVFFAGDLNLGEHTLRGGFDYKLNDINNVFVFDNLGYYRFRSIDDFASGNYRSYSYRTGSNPSDPTPAADWSWANWGFFLQDTWDVNYNLSIVAGIRYDLPAVDDKPLYNGAFEDFYGFANNSTVDGNGVFQPRIGFNYDLGLERPTQLRGGIGLFMGSTAGVWLSNPFTNPGGNVITYSDYSGDAVDIVANSDALPTPGGSARMDVDVLDPNFEQPTIWKGNLALDHELPWNGIIASAEVNFSEVKNAIVFTHLNLGDATGTLPDGRLSYYCDTENASGGRCNYNPDFNDVVYLSNSSEGSTSSYTLSLKKPMEDELSWMVAYTGQDTKEVNDGGSSRAISNWGYLPNVNPNEPQLATSDYEISERMIASMTWRKHFFEGFATSVTMFYENRSGRPFSYVFGNDANGDRRYGNDLFYVPAGPGDVLFTDPSQEAAFFDFVNATPGLRENMGQVVSRNSDRSPWTTQLDLKVSQEIPFFGPGKGLVFLNITNFLNMINSDWGHIDSSSYGTFQVADFEGVDAETGKYIYDWNERTGLFSRSDSVGQSRWGAQFGIRYDF